MYHLDQTIRKFNRFELKYLISLMQAEQLKTASRAYMLPDEYVDPLGSYKLASLYYDSPELRCFWEKEDGIKFHRKLRVRLYETEALITDEIPVFIEIKQHIDRVT